MGIKIDNVVFKGAYLIAYGHCNTGLSYKHMKKSVGKYIKYYDDKYIIEDITTNFEQKSFILYCWVKPDTKSPVYNMSRWLTHIDEFNEIEDWIFEEKNNVK